MKLAQIGTAPAIIHAAVAVNAAARADTVTPVVQNPASGAPNQQWPLVPIG